MCFLTLLKKWVVETFFIEPFLKTKGLVGGFAPTQDMHDVWLMLVFGVGGYLMRKLDYPLAPAVLAIVLGPIAEPALRQSLLISGGDITVFFTRPIAGPITIIALLLILLPLFKLLSAKVFATQKQ